VQTNTCLDTVGAKEVHRNGKPIEGATKHRKR
jgi:hypothetical protein